MEKKHQNYYNYLATKQKEDAKTMKKIIALLLAVVMCLSVFAGCGGKTEEPANPAEAAKPEAPAAKQQDVITLRWWAGIPAENGPANVVAAFNEQFKDKGIQVEYERYVNDTEGNLKLDTSLMASGDIDVYVSYGVSRLAQRVDSNMALNLTELIKRDGFDYEGLFGEAVRNTYINGAPYSISTTITKGSFLVNKDMFDAAGIEIPESWTFEEFREVCKKLTSGEGQDKVYGVFWNTQQNISEYWTYLAKRSLGGNAYYKDGGAETNFDNEVLQAAAQLVYDTMQDGTAPTHVDSVTQKLTQEGMFLTGKCAMTVGNWIIRSVKNTEEYPHDFVTAYAPYPVFSEDAAYTYGVAGDATCINPKSENIDAAWEFVKWYATEGVLSMAVGGRIPLCSTIDQDAIIELFLSGTEDLIDAESAKACLLPKAGEVLTPETITTSGEEIKQVLNEEVEAYFTGQKDLAEAFADAKERADEFLK